MRLEAARPFALGEKSSEIAAELRVHVRTVEKWRQRWREGSVQALSSRGPTSSPRLSDAQLARLERELERGPLAHGFADQRWTPARAKTLIGRMFHVSYTIQGVRKLLVRWSALACKEVDGLPRGGLPC
ncbi:transposase [Streptomyces sp. NPDC060035]|uniref:helix-turn-helix domain-containing protein n=1 Tax=Streptomyces sp. NPDC060035 TaxID=3347044 RepID=UPI0036919FB3